MHESSSKADTKLIAGMARSARIAMQEETVVRSYPVRYRRRARKRARAIATQGRDLAIKAGVDLAVAWGCRAGANYFCTRQNPDYALCNAFNDLAEQKKKQADNSVLAFGLWGGIVLLAAIFEK